MYLQFAILIIVSFIGGILVSLQGWMIAKKPDGTREPWDSRMFLASMINILFGAVIGVGSTAITGEVTVASYIAAFTSGIAADVIIHNQQKPPTTSIPAPPTPTVTPATPTSEPVSAGKPSQLIPPLPKS